MENVDHTAAILTAIMSGLATVITALAVLVQALRVSRQMSETRRDVNGRLDQLLFEQEERVRAQERLRHAMQPQEVLPPPPALGRGDPVIRQFPQPPEEKGGQ